MHSFAPLHHLLSCFLLGKSATWWTCEVARTSGMKWRKKAFVAPGLPKDVMHRSLELLRSALVTLASRRVGKTGGRNRVEHPAQRRTAGVESSALLSCQNCQAGGGDTARLENSTCCRRRCATHLASRRETAEFFPIGNACGQSQRFCAFCD